MVKNRRSARGAGTKKTAFLMGTTPGFLGGGWEGICSLRVGYARARESRKLASDENAPHSAECLVRLDSQGYA